MSAGSAVSPARTALVLGYGSIGKRHARALAARGVRLAIVNRGVVAREGAIADHASAQVCATLEELDHKGFPWASSVAVIASWGPSHAAHARSLSDRGVQRILCEKPMASSVADAEAMARRAKLDGHWLGLNHTLRYAALHGGLDAVARAFNLGQPIAVFVEGGAACIATNGIHWLDFACQMFGGPPRGVVSTASGSPINPRSPDLAMWGGTAAWDFGEGREAVISLSNVSSIAHEARVFFRDAVAQVRYVSAENDAFVNVRVSRRDPVAVQLFPAITRTGAAREVVFDGPIPGVRSFVEGLDAAAGELLDAQEPTCPPSVGVTAVSSIVGALVASRQGKAVQLPIDPASPEGEHRWSIS